MSIERIAIIGAGQAAAQAIDILHRRGYQGSIAMIGEEPHLPYQRPPLSKKYLAGLLERNRLLIRPEAYYAEHGVDLHLGCRVEGLSRREQRVILEDGTFLAYDALLIATGSRPRSLSAPGADLDGVHYLRTAADAERMRFELGQPRRLVVVGGGYIGLEVAATCRERGHHVTVLEMAERVMNRVVCREISTFFEAEHARRGVRIHCNARVHAFRHDSGSRRVRSVVCEDGSEYPADLVVIGIGVEAAAQVARDAGLACSNGIVVDAGCRTSDPRIYAAGDCTDHPSPRYDRRLRLESVDNAYEQATSAALGLLGESVVHDKVPWFWSDQYDVKLVIIGLSAGYDAMIVRGDPAKRSFSVCYLRGGELIAIDTVNSPKDQMVARKLVASGMRPCLEKLADSSRSLKDCS